MNYTRMKICFSTCYENLIKSICLLLTIFNTTLLSFFLLRLVRRCRLLNQLTQCNIMHTTRSHIYLFVSLPRSLPLPFALVVVFSSFSHSASTFFISCNNTLKSKVAENVQSTGKNTKSMPKAYLMFRCTQQPLVCKVNFMTVRLLITCAHF